MESTSLKDTIRSVPPGDPAGLGAIDRASTVTHTRPAATVSACGLPPTVIVGRPVGDRVDARHGSVAAVGDPHRPATDRHPGRRAADRDRGRHRPCVRIDPDDGLVVKRIDHPDPTVARGDRARAVANRDRLDQPVGSTRIDVIVSLSGSLSVTTPPPRRPRCQTARRSDRPLTLRSGERIQPVERPFDGATHTESPCAATAPGPSGTTLPICTGARVR